MIYGLTVMVEAKRKALNCWQQFNAPPYLHLLSTDEDIEVNEKIKIQSSNCHVQQCSYWIFLFLSGIKYPMQAPMLN